MARCRYKPPDRSSRAQLECKRSMTVFGVGTSLWRALGDRLVRHIVILF